MNVLHQWLLWFAQHVHSVEGMVLFVCFYAAATVLMLPASALTLLAGAVYGVAGLPLVWLGSNLGAGTAFILGRKVLHGFVSQRFGHTRWLRVLRQAIEQNGLQMVILLRLAVFIPFGAVNYCLSLTSLPLLTFFVGSFLGMLLPSLLYVYTGAVAGTLVEALAQQEQQTDATLALQMLGLVSVVLLLWLIRKSSTQLRQLEQRVEKATEEKPTQ